MLYIWVITVANLIVIGANVLYSLFASEPLFSVARAIYMTPILTVAVIAVDGVFAFLIRRMPEKWFSAESPLSNVSKKECALYKKLGVRKWRDKVPELGCFTSFHKDRVYDPSSNDYIRRYILEANYGVVIHVACVPLGFLIVFFAPLSEALYFAVPVAAVNAVLNLMPAFVLRYNIPKLFSLMRSNQRRALAKSDRS